MIVRNVERADLDAALAAVNRQYDDNIRFRSGPDWLARSRGGGQSWRLTLTVNDSRGPGGRLSHSGRRVAAACWHVHGVFFDSLPGRAVIVANGVKSRPGGQWVDRNIGSMAHPLMYSQACECQ